MAVRVAERHEQRVLGMPRVRSLGSGQVWHVGAGGVRRPVEAAVRDEVGAVAQVAVVEQRAPHAPVARVPLQQVAGCGRTVHGGGLEVVPGRAVHVDHDHPEAERLPDRRGDRRQQLGQLLLAAHEAGDLEEPVQALERRDVAVLRRQSAPARRRAWRRTSPRRPPHQRVRVGSVFGADCDAEAGRVPGLPAHLLREPVDHAIGHLTVGLGQDQRELVAAGAEHRIGRPHRPGQDRRHVEQRAVAREVAGAVVDELEPVEVAHHQREGLPVALRARQLEPQPARERAPVEQPRERIVLGQEPHLAEPVGRLEDGGGLVREHPQRLQQRPRGQQPVARVVDPDQAHHPCVAVVQRHH